MGQYHVIFNIDKKEYLSLGGAKLWEKASCLPASMGLLVLLANSNGRGGGDLNNPVLDNYPKPGQYSKWSNAKQKKIKCSKNEYLANERALKAISGRWAGDRIVIQGDYAESTDPCYLADTSEFKDITPLLIKAFDLLCKNDEKFIKTLDFEKNYL